VLWPIAVVLFDADLVTRSGGIICEPMQSRVGGDLYDREVKSEFDRCRGDLDLFQSALLEMDWTRRKRETTFDICLDSRVVGDLATSFKRIWNEKIVEEAQREIGEKKAALLNAWLIGGARE
jgi:hypothetical protein